MMQANRGGLDIVVAWAVYVLLKPANRNLSVLVAWLRVVFAAVFVYALANLLDVAQLLGNAAYVATLPTLFPSPRSAP